MINWNIGKEDTQTISKIVDRYINDAIELGIPKQLQRDRMSLHMDIAAVHGNGTPLRLNDLLNADNFNFTHDMIGIQANLNRKNGTLENCFVPRFAL